MPYAGRGDRRSAAQPGHLLTYTCAGRLTPYLKARPRPASATARPRRQLKPSARKAASCMAPVGFSATGWPKQATNSALKFAGIPARVAWGSLAFRGRRHSKAATWRAPCHEESNPQKPVGQTIASCRLSSGCHRAGPDRPRRTMVCPTREF